MDTKEFTDDDWAVLKMARSCPYPEWVLFRLPNGLWGCLWYAGLGGKYSTMVVNGDYSLCGHVSMDKNEVMEYMAKDRDPSYGTWKEWKSPLWWKLKKPCKPQSTKSLSARATDMIDNVDNLVLEQLRALRSEIQTMRSEMHREFHDLKHRMPSLESAMVGVKRDVNHCDETDARQQVSLDRIVGVPSP